MNRSTMARRLAVTVVGFAIGSVLVAGCGFIADKDRIVVAKLDGKKISRGDLAKYIHDLDDDDRPLIQNKSDLLDTLNGWINDQVTAALAAQLKSEGKIDVSRDAAREACFQKHPEFRAAYKATDPTPMGINQADLNALQAEIEFRTDDVVKRLLQDEALKYKMRESFQNKTITVTADDARREYDRRKDEFVKPEYIEYIALQLPLSMPDAITRAGDARRRIDAGEKIDDVLRPYLAQDAKFGKHGVLDNDPAVGRFKSFWEAAHGAAAGQIIGPVLMPEHDEVVLDAQTQQQVKRTWPAAQLVLEVIKHEAERPKTFEEAANDLAADLVKQRALDQIRTDHGVEVYEKQLPNPAGVGDQFKDSMIKTGKPKRTN